MFEKNILFWEVSAGDTNTFLAAFRTLETQGFLQKVSGLIVGKMYDEFRPECRKGILEITAPYGFPIIGNADFGHQNGSFMPFPEGLWARLDASKLVFDIRESMVE